MKQIKVKALFGSHPIYQEIVNYPPRNIKYVGFGKETADGAYYQKKKAREWTSRILRKANLPRMIYLPKVNADLIHSSRGILILNKKPWVIDVEHISSFTNLDEEIIKKQLPRRIVKKFLESKNCKKIMPHVQASAQMIKKFFNSEIINKKIEILYPTTHIPKFMKKNKDLKKKRKKIIILFVAGAFNRKGGLFVLEVFKKLEKKYKNIELWIKSDTPKEIKKKYKSNNIKYFKFKEGFLPREVLLKKFHAEADIFLYPAIADSFGYGLLDAMCCKLPIITSNNYAIPETVKNNKNGFIIDMKGNKIKRWINIEEYTVKDKERIINDIIKHLVILIKNKQLRKKMGEYGFKLVSKGKFSIKKRNKKLERIYKEALKND